MIYKKVRDKKVEEHEFFFLSLFQHKHYKIVPIFKIKPFFTEG